MASTIYKIRTSKGVFYSYTVAKVGSEHGATPSSPNNGEEILADIHSHGDYDEGYSNNDFSGSDMNDNVKKERDGYLATPNGSLKHYDYRTRVTKIISEDLPSDSKDPDRKNDIKPTDIPKQKEEDEKQKNAPAVYRGYHGE